MSVFGFLLVLTVRRQRQRSERLLHGKSRSNAARTTVVSQSKSKAREGSHTTAMLVSVIALFLITEFPQGVLAPSQSRHPCQLYVNLQFSSYSS